MQSSSVDDAAGQVRMTRHRVRLGSASRPPSGAASLRRR
jgi:hypothetical protein